MNIAPGKYAEAACQLEDKSRGSHAQYKSTPKVKKGRKIIRQKRTKRRQKQTEGGSEIRC